MRDLKIWSFEIDGVSAKDGVTTSKGASSLEHYGQMISLMINEMTVEHLVYVEKLEEMLQEVKGIVTDNLLFDRGFLYVIHLQVK